ncbi:AmmeMemoRadiSam system protein A [Syntrophomonas palmitatica]|uniref:AmmeMemoRadiSam system protein A n=1 Tax=Syntrophomonas palmitatica TaxID=402877 RepID=UPI0006D193EE|nr:AmmeMemoRadiSam system protein A [Syntrophomonas palmitatica]
MITYGVLSPHPPLLIPDIGGSRIREVETSRRGMREMSRQLVESCPETIIFLTPHGNVFSDALSALGENLLQGDFSNFGSRVGTSVTNDLELLAEIEKRSNDAGTNFVTINKEMARKNNLQWNLDHGILVPLFYLQEAGLSQVQVIAVSIGFLPILELYAFGRILREASEIMGRRVAIVASGDMSHRLKDERPYDYHPDGARFDAAVKDNITRGDVTSIIELPEKLRDNAGECGYRSLVILLGALDGCEFKSQVFSYEGPFGVGYLTAGFLPVGDRDSLLQEFKRRQLQDISRRRQEESLPVRWARMTLENYIKTGQVPAVPYEVENLRKSQAGVFVSLKKNGQLRGCIGTIMPAYGDLAEEISHNAVAAGTQDPRFSPVQIAELPELVYSVDILGEPEPTSREELDPHRYGVIVSAGRRRGLLLPDLEGVDTVEEQIYIALHKAGIDPSEKYKLERFEVKRYK